MTRRACDGRRVIEKDRKKEELTSGQFFLSVCQKTMQTPLFLL